ncbi:hypothetical protein GDO81_005997 [Engystomops pustulosus]|uniref:Secreted protein n=1 Tax=Engystomops pustulosus TaxID=76066 RepID=A0AAV7CWQ5_ENGPU|nr:hypothetical protein GDO81_005997 [Engystomops pustulosus]
MTYRGPTGGSFFLLSISIGLHTCDPVFCHWRSTVQVLLSGYHDSGSAAVTSALLYSTDIVMACVPLVHSRRAAMFFNCSSYYMDDQSSQLNRGCPKDTQ